MVPSPPVSAGRNSFAQAFQAINEQTSEPADADEAPSSAMPHAFSL
jgi:hypothetical protein